MWCRIVACFTLASPRIRPVVISACARCISCRKIHPDRRNLRHVAEQSRSWLDSVSAPGRSSRAINRSAIAQDGKHSHLADAVARGDACAIASCVISTRVRCGGARPLLPAPSGRIGIDEGDTRAARSLTSRGVSPSGSRGVDLDLEVPKWRWNDGRPGVLVCWRRFWGASTAQRSTSSLLLMHLGSQITDLSNQTHLF